MQLIRKTSGPATIMRKWNQLGIIRIITMKDLRWLDFDNEPRVQ